MNHQTDPVSAWHTPEIAKINGRPKAYEWKVKNKVGMEPLLQIDEIARYDSVGKALRSMNAHEFVGVKGTASLYDCIVLGKAAAPDRLWPNFDDHNNDPLNYHGTGTFEGREYNEDGRNPQPESVWRSVINEFDELFEPKGGHILNEVKRDTEQRDRRYLQLVRSVAPMMHRRGMKVVVQAPGPWGPGIYKGVHLAMNKAWSLRETLDIVNEFLDFNRSIEELWIGRGSAWHEHEAKQLMIAIRRSFEHGRPLVVFFVGEEGFPRQGPVWMGRTIQTFAWSDGKPTTFGHMLDAYLRSVDPVDPPPDHRRLALGAVRSAIRRVNEGIVDEDRFARRNGDATRRAINILAELAIAEANLEEMK